jgi:hypothetical protein
MTAAGAPRPPTLQLKGWTAAETTAFVAARGNFGTVEQAQSAAKGGAKVTTTAKNADPADLQWPATDPGNAGLRDQFRLNTFPPAGGNSAPPTLQQFEASLYTTTINPKHSQIRRLIHGGHYTLYENATHQILPYSYSYHRLHFIRGRL